MKKLVKVIIKYLKNLKISLINIKKINKDLKLHCLLNKKYQLNRTIYKIYN
jgi:hypothetical protein